MTYMTRMKIDKNIRRFILIVVVVLQIGCQPKREPQECEDFFSTKVMQKEETIRTYELEKQLLIQKCALDRRPTSHFSYQIAEKGRSIIPKLLEHLEKSPYENSYDKDKYKYGIIGSVSQFMLT